MKKILCIILLLNILLSLCACKQKSHQPVSSDAAPTGTADTTNTVPNESTAETAEENTAVTEVTEESAAETFPETTAVTEYSEETTAPTQLRPIRPEGDLSFEDLKFYTFRFSSGTGAWRTLLTIQPDGDFSGIYHDSNMGETGDGYSRGSAYRSDFTGKFQPPVKINEYTYSITLESIRYRQQPGTEEIRDSIFYHYTEAYGVHGTKNFLIYLPGTPLEILPESFLRWTSLIYPEETELPYYGLYAPDTENGFSSYNIVAAIHSEVSWAESSHGSFESRLQEAETQTDMNILANDHYRMWDNLLNELWTVLNQVLDKDTMDALTIEELDWISQKEKAVADAGAGYEGGSLYTAIAAEIAADMTRDRVYELLEYLS